MQYLPVELQTKELFRHYLGGGEKALATYCFSSFYLWRHWERYRWAVVADALSVAGSGCYCVPVSPCPDSVCRAVEELISQSRQQSRPLLFTDVTENDAALLQKAFPSVFAVNEYRDGANYIYEKKDMLTLSGKKYHSKRNHLNRFLRAYPDCKLEKIEERHIPACRSLLAKWLGRRKRCPSVCVEYAACLDCLTHLPLLDCEGAVLSAGGRIAAFSIGEMLTADTWLVHFEKADTDIPGAYQAINSLGAALLPQGCRYINRAEDMGIAGLRQAKLSYHPCRMEKEFRLRLL